MTTFEKWLTGSKVVDADGQPLKVYHGTPHGDFATFKVPAFSTSSEPDAEFYHHGSDDTTNTECP